MPRKQQTKIVTFFQTNNTATVNTESKQGKRKKHISTGSNRVNKIGEAGAVLDHKKDHTNLTISCGGSVNNPPSPLTMSTVEELQDAGPDCSPSLSYIVKPANDAATHSKDKSLIVFADLLPSMRSENWNLCEMVDYDDSRKAIMNYISQTASTLPEGHLASVSTGLYKVLTGENFVVCKACWKITSASLDQALIACKVHANYVSQNVKQHYITKIFNDCIVPSKPSMNDSDSQSLTMTTTSASSMLTKQQKQSTLSFRRNSKCPPAMLKPSRSSTQPHSDDGRQVSLDTLLWTKENLTQSKKEAIREIHVEAFRLISDCNVSPLTAQSSAFARYTNFCIQKGIAMAKVLRHIPNEDVSFGRRRYYSIQAESFAQMVLSITVAVERVRQFHKERTVLSEGNGFIYVAHDIWDGKRKCILGLSIFFVDPVFGVNIQVPLGFVMCKGKSASTICEQSMLLLARYGIVPTDLLQPINDTTNSALAAGRLIVGGGVDGKCESGTCFMHRGALVLNHAGGFITRSKNGVVTDQFPESASFRRKVHDMVGYLMDKKSKDRWKRYTSLVNTAYNCDPNLIPMPNKTRTTGVFLMYEATIRSCHALRLFHSRTAATDRTFQRLCLLPEEWTQLAEFTAIFRIFAKFLIAVQSDDYAHISLIRIHLGSMLEDLYFPSGLNECIYEPKFEKMFLEVADVNGAGDWSPRVQYDKIPKITISYTNDYDREASQEDTNSTPTAVASVNTKRLVERLFLECRRYFSILSDEEELSILCNPVTVIHGVEYLTSMGMLSADKIVTMEDKLIQRVVKYYTAGLKDNLNVAAVKESGGVVGKEAETEIRKTPVRVSSEQDKFQRRKRLRDEAENKQKTSNMNEPVRRAIGVSYYQTGARQELDSFKQLISSMNDEDWCHFVIRYPSEAMQNDIDAELSAIPIADRPRPPSEPFITKSTEWDKVPCNCIYTQHLFDVLKFWRSHADKFPLIYPVAITILAKPPTNARQERLFSWATWFDDTLRQRLSESGFEMRLLEKANRDFVEKEKKLYSDPGNQTSIPYRRALQPDVEEVISQQQRLSLSILGEGLDIDENIDAPSSTFRGENHDSEAIQFCEDILVVGNDEEHYSNPEDGLGDVDELFDDDNGIHSLCLKALREYTGAK